MRESNEPIQALSGGLGFVCVRNRTNEEQKSGMTFEQIRQVEKELFASKPELAQLAAENKGMDALIERLVGLQRKMVLDYRFEFKEQLSTKLRELEDKIVSMDKACVTDQQRQAIFKDSLSNLQQDLEELSTGIYYRAGREPEMRLRARLDELLKKHF